MCAARTPRTKLGNYAPCGKTLDASNPAAASSVRLCDTFTSARIGP
jgi:hypothetical protein